jgi:hypothetical protein
MMKLSLTIILLFLVANNCRALSNNKMAEEANFALRQRASTTRFITNKMCPFGKQLHYYITTVGGGIFER